MNSIAYTMLWLFVSVLPWEGVVRVNNTAILSQATGMLAMGCTVFAVIASGRLRRWHTLHVAALLFVLTAAFDLLVFHRLGVRLPAKFYTYLQLLLMVWMIWELAPTRGRVLNLLLAYVLGAYMASFQTLLLYRSSGGGLRRFAAGGVDPNDLAMTMSLGLPMAWYLSNTYRKPVIRWICRGYLPIGVLAIGLTGSRGGLLASIVALTIVPLSMTRLSPRRLTITIAMLFLSGGLAVAYVPEKIVERLATTSTEVEDLRLGGRFKLWRAGLRALPEHPLLGYGTSGFIGAITPQLGPASQVAHNSFISVLVEQGFIGLSLFLVMFVAAYRAVRRLPLLERRFGLVLMATLVVAMLPLTWEHRKPLWFILAALVGLSQALRVATAGGLDGRIRPGTPVVRSPRSRRPVGPIAARPWNAGA
jgi:O-antigen ligase